MDIVLYFVITLISVFTVHFLIVNLIKKPTDKEERSKIDAIGVILRKFGIVGVICFIVTLCLIIVAYLVRETILTVSIISVNSESLDAISDFITAIATLTIMLGGISVIFGGIGAILGGISAILGGISRILRQLDSRQSKKIKKNYPKLSIVGIMLQHRDNQKFKTIYLLLIATIIYIFASKFFNFDISNILLLALLGSILLIALESLIFNYRINKGWYGSSESEAREIIDFIVKNSEDIDFTDGNNPKSVIKPEDIQQVVEELGIQIPGYPEPNAINQSFSEG